MMTMNDLIYSIANRHRTIFHTDGVYEERFDELGFAKEIIRECVRELEDSKSSDDADTVRNKVIQEQIDWFRYHFELVPREEYDE